MDSIPNHGYDNLTISMEEDYNMERIHLPEIDGALLMELLDDVPSTDECENERLNFVIQSFEAEIGSDSGLMVVGDGESTTGPNDMDSEDGGLECVDFDFDKYDELKSTMYDVGDDALYAWKEMDMATVGPTGQGWYVMDENEDLVIGEQREIHGSAYNFVGEYAYMEQVYSPLWQ
ncbi:hypothetical protein LUZ62_021000 [Rhynchospora pubera]|uniref:Uncharacterized protein n=1 Tax=Rhynchospora pubera TaxID=906938 RepID=A0AAV8GVL4_9POAL|nr:hypothetical protein LUZ62_021000 [Rhynchospora pubera]